MSVSLYSIIETTDKATNNFTIMCTVQEMLMSLIDKEMLMSPTDKEINSKNFIYGSILALTRSSKTFVSWNKIRLRKSTFTFFILYY